MNNHHTILLVEDELNLGETIKDFLGMQQHSVSWAKTCQEAKELFQQIQPSIVLMDIGLPDGNGIELAKELKKKRHDFILFFLSAWNDSESKLEGLEIGADDYITKPFALKELALRLERILSFKKAQCPLPDEIKIGALKIWFKKYEIEDAQGKKRQLSQAEAHLLELLYKNLDTVLSREKIIDEIWGKDAYTSSRTVDNYIVNLRRWCDSDPHKQVQILSIRGIGYRMTINA